MQQKHEELNPEAALAVKKNAAELKKDLAAPNSSRVKRSHEDGAADAASSAPPAKVSHTATVKAERSKGAGYSKIDILRRI